MDANMQSKLSAVRRRQRFTAALHGLMFGLLLGSLLAVTLEAARRGLGLWTAPWGWAGLLAGAVVGGAFGYSRPTCEHRAAKAMDARCNLKDRATTALEFSHHAKQTAGEMLALRDAETHVRQVDPTRAAPIHLPRQWRTCTIAVVAAMMVVAWPYTLPEGQAAPLPPDQNILNVAGELRTDIEKLEELLKQAEEKDLDEMVEKLKELTEQMEQPGVDVTEALAQISEMEAAILQQQADYSVMAMDEQLAALGEALASIQSMEAAGAALAQGKLDEAAKELEKLEMPEMKPADREQAKEKLKQLAEAMKQAGAGQLSQATSDLGDAVGGGGGGAVGQAGKNLSKQVQKHQKRKTIDNWMMQQLARLSESKGECKGDKAGNCSACSGGGCSSCNKNGGNANRLSDKSSTNWGRGASGNEQGAATSLDSKRNMEQITGTQGEGPQDVETIRSLEGKQEAGRAYQDVYREYQKMSEAVLENEPIPLGHRQTIRRYFELIRPEGAAPAASEAPATPE